MLNAVRATSANFLRHGSEVLERLIRDEGLLVVGAEYSPETGVITFFEVPACVQVLAFNYHGRQAER